MATFPPGRPSRNMPPSAHLLAQFLQDAGRRMQACSGLILRRTQESGLAHRRLIIPPTCRYQYQVKPGLPAIAV